MDFLKNIDINQLLPTAISWGSNLLLALIILLIGFWVAGRVKKAINRMSERHEELDDTLFRFLSNIAYYLVLAIVLIAVLNRFGVQTASIIAMLGAAGLAIGLALQGTLSNFAAGVMLLIFRPFKVGDFVDAGGKFGCVSQLDVFTTVLQTFDNQQIIIPNSKIWGEQIINHSHHEIRGVEMHFGIAYAENTIAARKVIEQVLENHPNILKDPEPFIEVETLNNSSVDFLVRPFCQGEDYFKVLYSVPEQIKLALDENNIEIPFPHRKVIVVNEN